MCFRILLRFFILLLYVHAAVQRISHEREFGLAVNPDDYDTDDADDFDNDNVDLPLQPRRPPVPVAGSTTVKKSQTTTTASTPSLTATAGSPNFSCPSSVQPPPSSSLTDSSNSPHWQVRTNWLLERGPDGLVTGGLVTVAGGAAQALRVLPTSLPLKCQETSESPSSSSSSLAGVAAAHNCEAAIATSAVGAGCLGQPVSDGHQLLRGTGDGGGEGANYSAHFGITDNGEVFFGYPDNRLKRLGQFKQLIGGRGWLVRNGENFVSTSLRFETCSRAAGPRSASAAAAAAAAAPSSRSAIGQNQAGELALVHIVGRPGVAGLSLASFADLLIRLGMRQAVNLDAGDAAGLVVNGTLIGSPSAACDSSSLPFACVRPAATVLCVSRRPLKSPSTPPMPATGTGTPVVAASCRDDAGAPCSPIGGRCNSNGRCVCMPYFEGPGCARRRCLCLNGGVCQLPDSDACRCQPGYTGRLCELACQPGFYGQDCARVCVCAGGQSVACNPVNGTCAGVSDLAKNESSLLRSIQQRLLNLGSINVALIGLTSVLSLSLLLNLCLLVQCCRMRCRRRRREKATGKTRYQPMRLVPTGRESDSDPEAVM